jgi:hypothetical protein
MQRSFEESWRAPAPLQDPQKLIMGHQRGGKDGNRDGESRESRSGRWGQLHQRRRAGL